MTILAEKEGLTYEFLEAKDLVPVADMVAHGFTDGSEPIALALGLGLEQFKQFLEALLPKFLQEGLSIVARDAQTGEIAGAQLNEEMSMDMPVDPSQFEWAAPVLALASDLYEQYFQEPHPAPNEAVHMVVVGVSRLFRGKGVAHHLLDLSLEHARGRGYRRAVVEATGIISQHVFLKAGFAARVEIPYATFEFQGKRPFENTGVHPSIMLMDKAI